MDRSELHCGHGAVWEGNTPVPGGSKICDKSWLSWHHLLRRQSRIRHRRVSSESRNFKKKLYKIFMTQKRVVSLTSEHSEGTHSPGVTRTSSSVQENCQTESSSFVSLSVDS